MVQSRARKGTGEPAQSYDVPAQQAAANAAMNRQPWYELAREAAQIIVSALALYASAKGFLKKIRERRGA
ncbi:MAG: hypothetical protein JW854_07825 [Actinobacteria bacterium]|nr:hypothetical protein [Actinomycetota bacterium]